MPLVELIGNRALRNDDILLPGDTLHGTSMRAVIVGRPGLYGRTSSHCSGMTAFALSKFED